MPIKEGGRGNCLVEEKLLEAEGVVVVPKIQQPLLAERRGRLPEPLEGTRSADTLTLNS